MKEKALVRIFVAGILALALYFNLYFIYTASTDGIMSLLTTGVNVSDAMKVVEDTTGSYYNKLIKSKRDISTYARVGAFIDIYGLVQKVLNNNLVTAEDSNQSVVRLTDGHLIFGENQNKKDFSEQARSIKDFSEWLANNDIDFLFAKAPSKEINKDHAPAGFEVPPDSTNDLILESLIEENINYLDLRKNPKLDKDVSNWHYFTDHHWTTETALLSAGYLIEEINKAYKYGLDPSPLMPDKFTTELHEDIFLGSSGKKVGNYYCGRDDYEIILPKEKNDFYFEFTHESGEVERRSGDFESTFVFRENLKKDYYYTNTYCVYMGGDYPISIIKNNSLDKGKRILILKDSYANAALPFLAMVFKEITVIDPRYFQDSVKEYIQESNPDMVLMLYSSKLF